MKATGHMQGVLVSIFFKSVEAAPAPSQRRLKWLFLLAVLFGGSSLTIFILRTTANYESIYENRHYQLPNDSSTIRTPGCRIPFMQPFCRSVLPFVEYPKNMTPCKPDPLLKTNKTHIWIEKQNIPYYNITNKSLSCCYTSFFRPVQINNIESYDIDDRVKYNDCNYFSDTIKVTDEFVRVICYNDFAQKVFDTFFLFALEKSNSFDELSKTLPYNILILGIDSVSRLNFHRTMPKTLSYLYDLDAIELLGYNKVGDNTYPNLMALLLGRKETELWDTCVPNSESTFDNCPFVWERFRQSGFVTALGEDSAQLGTFNYLRRGFLDLPTHYYLHTFMSEAEHHAGTNKPYNAFLCMNDKFFFSILLDYIEDLTAVLKSKLFGFFWEITMSHDTLNYPMVMDDSYVELIRKMHHSGYLNEAIIFLVSDHGIRWGEFRSTEQGHLEERLPFVFALMPPSFRNKYSKAYDNLKLNSRRLTTPFDMHATLSDLSNLDNIENARIIARSKEQYSSYRNISLFLPIPSNRTCKLADIDDHWCTCHRSKKMSTNTWEAKAAAKHVVSHMNDLLLGFPQCAKLAVSEVVGSTKMLFGMPGDANVTEWPALTVVVRTRPGGGVFEATLERERGPGHWALAGSVSRLNLYGNQSECVHHSQLKLYCYCTIADDNLVPTLPKVGNELLR